MLEDLVGRRLRDSLDGQEHLLGRERDALDRVVARHGQLLADVGLDPVLLLTPDPMSKSARARERVAGLVVRLASGARAFGKAGTERRGADSH